MYSLHHTAYTHEQQMKIIVHRSWNGVWHIAGIPSGKPARAVRGSL
jgi:hypothetical protein